MVSITGTQEYARARVQLERADRRALAYVDDGELDLFVCSHYGNRTVLRTVMWHSPCVDRRARFRSLRRWYESAFPERTLLGGHMACEADRSAWQEAQ